MAVNFQQSIQIRNISISSITGKTANLTLQNVHVSFTESVFSPAISGKLTITELPENPIYESLPIVGQEILRFEYTQMGLDISLLFRIYKLSPVRTEQNNISYDMFFTTESMLTNQKQRVSKSYSDTLHHEMVRDIINNEMDIGGKKRFYYEKTKTKETYIVPNLRPYRAISYIAQRALSENDYSNYVFYETIDAFYFTSLQKLSTQEPKYTYTYGSDTVLRDDTGERKIVENPYAIQNFNVRKQADVLSLVTDGFFASQVTSIDLIRRKIHKYEYDYASMFTDMPHMNKHPLFHRTENFDQEGKQYYLYGNETILDSDYVQENDAMQPDLSFKTRLKQKMQLLAFDNYTITMSIAGNPTLFAGNVININIPLRRDDSGNVLQHRLYGGNHMITTITHDINRGSYTQRVELVKDSLVRKLEG